jgi:hypothetical protein
MLGFITRQIYFRKVIHKKNPNVETTGGISIYNNNEKIRVQKYQWQYQKSDSIINISNPIKK